MSEILRHLINFQILSVCFSWLVFDKEKRRKFRAFCKNVEADKAALKVQKNYSNIVSRIKRKKDKIRVLFLVSENSKWKAQSLYDAMKESQLFEPIIAISTITKVASGKDSTRDEVEYNKEFFAKKGMQYVVVYENGKYVDLKKYSPDVVFYQQPWYIPKIHSPAIVSKFALLCYIPYYVMNYGGEMDYNLPFHKYLFRHYLLNDEWTNLYKKLSGLDNFVSAGHTALDVYFNKSSEKSKGYVIYAPHYSFCHEKNENPVNYGTILDNGKQILEFAKAHNELNWIFKPHPQLKFSLLKSGFTQEYVDEYYKEWEKIGLACYDSSYSELFLQSKALITDSASFLIEYFCTKKPIIHLISEKCKIVPMEPSKKIFDTFYQVHNLNEMYEIFEQVIVNGQDAKRDARLKMLEESGLLNNNASENIVDDLKKVFS